MRVKLDIYGYALDAKTFDEDGNEIPPEKKLSSQLHFRHPKHGTLQPKKATIARLRHIMANVHNPILRTNYPVRDTMPEIDADSNIIPDF